VLEEPLPDPPPVVLIVIVEPEVFTEVPLPAAIVTAVEIPLTLGTDATPWPGGTNIVRSSAIEVIEELPATTVASGITVAAKPVVLKAGAQLDPGSR
jgi:hypothetical protein